MTKQSNYFLIFGMIAMIGWMIVKLNTNLSIELWILMNSLSFVLIGIGLGIKLKEGLK